MNLRIVRDPREVPPDTALAIGNFDGVHLGHQALLARVVATASRKGIVPAVMTFEPLPREHFLGERAPPRLLALGDKITAFAASGIELAYICRFNASFAALSPEDFARRLRERHGVRHVFVGGDFRFGARRSGDVTHLAHEGGRLGFEVEVVPFVEGGGDRVSSTRIREALANGDLELAARLMGRPYSICGRVRHGAKLGRELGFPTANVKLRRGRPALTGVFAVKCFGAATRGLEGVASLGFKPAVTPNGPATLEAFLFDFSGDLYGRRLTIEFLKKLRDEAHFASLDELASQIRRDCEWAQAYFRGPRT